MAAFYIKGAYDMFQQIPKAKLGFFPTPFYKLEKLSEILGVNLYIKRDDFTGQNLFGGNKTRKLTYLLGKAKAEGATHVFTYGATQSNHAMQTCWAAVSQGLKPILYLVSVVEPDMTDVKANLLLDYILGAEVHIISPEPNESFLETNLRAAKLARTHMNRLAEDGYCCYDIPMGGANAIGTAGYIEGFVELFKQAKAEGVNIDYLYHATGSGGTMAGLVAGSKLMKATTKVVSVVVLDIPEDYCLMRAQMANEALNYLGHEPLVTEEDFSLDLDHYAPGYECPNEAGTKAIALLARSEGLLLDPVYTGKAFGALLSAIESGDIPQGSHVAFLHTGGATALFAEKSIVGPLANTL